MRSAARTGTGAAFRSRRGRRARRLAGGREGAAALKPGFGLRFATLLASAGEDPDTVSRKGYAATLAQNVHGSSAVV